MPDPKDNTKQSGDTHPPEVEERNPAAADEDTEAERTPGRGENQAGFLKDRDAAGGSGKDKA